MPAVSWADHTCGMVNQGDCAYIVDENKELVVIDISDPADVVEGLKIINLY